MVSRLISVIFVALSVQLLRADGRMRKAHVVDVASLNNTSLISAGTTNYDDAMGLMLLTTTYPQLYGVQFPLLSNDPCYPEKLIWIECSNDPIRRVTALYLGAANLFATLPDFSTMDALEKIYLNNNILTGSIPEFLGNFPKLTYLNLANNYFTGTVPDSLSKNKKITLILTGNPGLCSSSNPCNSPPYDDPVFPTPPATPEDDHSQIPSTGGGGGGGESHKSHLATILGSTITPSVIITVVGVLAQCHRRRRRSAAAGGAAAPVFAAGVGN
ncbi:hypothetical protein ABFS82_14G249300 [Erythranthe guttata]